MSLDDGSLLRFLNSRLNRDDRKLRQEYEKLSKEHRTLTLVLRTLVARSPGRCVTIPRQEMNAANPNFVLPVIYFRTTETDMTIALDPEGARPGLITLGDI